MAIEWLAGKRARGTNSERTEITITTTVTDDFTPQLTWGQTGDKYSISGGKVQCAGYSSYNPNDFVYYDLGASYHAFDNDWTLKLKTFKSSTANSYLEFGITSDISNGDGGSMINGSVNIGGGSNNYPRINGAYGGTVYEHVTGSPNSGWDNVVYSELKFDKATNNVTQKGFTNSDYSTGQIGSTLTYTITPSNYSGMRYIFIGAITGTGRTDSSATYADDLDFTYTSTSVPTFNIQDGTIFEETDTNKAYIWSSSSQTWTQL